MRLVAVTRGSENVVGVDVTTHSDTCEFNVWIYVAVYYDVTSQRRDADGHLRTYHQYRLPPKEQFRVHLYKGVHEQGLWWEKEVEWLEKTFPENKVFPFLPSAESDASLNKGRRLIKALNFLPIKDTHENRVQLYEVKL